MRVELQLNEGDSLHIEEFDCVVEVKSIRDDYVTITGEGSVPSDLGQAQAREQLWKSKMSADELSTLTITTYSDGLQS